MAHTKRVTVDYEVFLSDQDSDKLAWKFYTEVPVMWGESRKFCDEVLYSDFIKALKSGELNEFTFRRMYINWYCGNALTRIGPKVEALK